MNKLLMILVLGMILGIIGFVIADDLILQDITAKPIAEQDIKQVTKEVQFEASDTSNINEVFSGVKISPVKEDGSFSIYKEGVINRQVKLDIAGKDKEQIEAEALEITKAELENIRPNVETITENPKETAYLTDEQVIDAKKTIEVKE
jgi:hypothetical protein